MANGEVKIPVSMDTSKAEKDLEKLKAKIEKAESALNAKSQDRSSIEERLNQARLEAEKTAKEIQRLNGLISEGEKFLSQNYKGNVSSDDYSRVSETITRLKGELTEQEKIHGKQVQSIDKIAKEYEKASRAIDKGTADLTEMKKAAGEMQREIEAGRPIQNLSDALDNAKGKLLKFTKYAIGIRSVYVLFKRLKTSIKESVQAFAEYDDETKNNIAELKSALQTLKVSWGGAFAPIFNAVVPILKKLIEWLTAAANAVAKFIAILSGKNTYKKAIANNTGVAGSLSDVAGAAKEAKAQLMGFDELNILEDNRSSGGSGGSGGGSDYAMLDEEVFDGSYISSLAMSVKDVLFDWSDLTPEQIVEKAISGLSTFLGAGVGFMIGGAPGAIVGALTGLTLSLLADAAIFDHDGQISTAELMDTLEIALNGLVGGVIGFALGGPAGALIGATIGTGLTLGIKALKPAFQNGSGSGLLKEILDGLSKGATLGVGAALGFMVGGVAGAAVGLTIAAILTFLVDRIKAKIGEQDQYDSKLEWFLHGVLSIPTKEDIVDWFKKIPEWIAEGISDFGTELHNIIVQPAKDFVEDIKGMFGNGGKETGEEYETGLTTWADTAKDSLFARAFGWVKSKLSGETPEYEDIGEESGESYEKGLNAWKSTSQNSLPAKIFGWITTNAKAILGDSSSASGLQLVGKNAMVGFENGITSKWPAIESIFKTKMPNISKTVTSSWNDVETNTGKTWENVKTTLTTKWDSIKTSAGTAWDAMKQKITGSNEAIENDSTKKSEEMKTNVSGKYSALSSTLMNTINNMKSTMSSKFAGIKLDTESKMEQMKNNVTAKFSSMHSQIANNISRIKDLMNFTWSLPRPRVPQIGWYYNSFYNGDGSSFSIPQFYVNWYAKGGIFDQASLIGVGEAGKEAVVPLERNTEWISMIADGLMDRLARNDFANRLADAFMATPRPAMAGGYIVPPNSSSARFGDGLSDTLLEEMATLKREIAALSNRPIEVTSKVMLDKREVGRAVTTYQGREARARG